VGNPATKKLLRYREALWEGFNELKKKAVLTTNVPRDAVVSRHLSLVADRVSARHQTATTHTVLPSTR
jgi:hypothetical protein